MRRTQPAHTSQGLSGPARYSSPISEATHPLGGGVATSGPLSTQVCVDSLSILRRVGTLNMVPKKPQGVIRFMIGSHWVADVVCDTTDINRPRVRHHPVIAVLVFSDPLLGEIKKYAKDELPSDVLIA